MNADELKLPLSEPDALQLLQREKAECGRYGGWTTNVLAAVSHAEGSKTEKRNASALVRRLAKEMVELAATST